METKVIAIRHWDDLVFENRNKEYGAYSLRRRYSKRVILAWGVSVAMLAALLISSQFKFGGEIKKTLVPIVGCTFDVKLIQPRPIIEERPRARQQTAPIKSATTKPPLVVPEPVEELPIVEASVVSTDGTDTGTAPVEGFDDGIGSVPVEIPVVIEVPQTVTIAEHMPEFEGGIEGMVKYITKSIRYPVSARRMMLEGTVFVRFVVMWDGSIEQVEVLRGFHPDCDKEAIRVIQKMPKWMAGSQNGKPVNVRMVLPIKFTLNV